MTCDVAPRRRSLRLEGYDYSQAGAYFVTICTHDRACLLGEVIDGSVRLAAAGQMLTTMWDSLATRFPDVALDAHVIMPNHLHGVIVLPNTDRMIVGTGLVTVRTDTADATGRPTEGRVRPSSTGCGSPLHETGHRAPALGTIIGAFKSTSTVGYIRGVKEKAWPEFRQRLWQRNYYEHVVRNEAELNRIRRYIEENPVRWDLDEENPHRLAS